ncbi:MAG: cytochrome bd ubiquinol oxidase subunit [Thermoleophilaceae bacterium]|nr:cytochrome bd ubiquinol oxidase subunit [Thermoleophilaceae bacterium]
MIDGVLGGPVDQDYLVQARQMQAMSFAVHIPLVCFGIAFPAMVLFLEGLWLRTGDPLYRALAKRWSKAMLILFAVGVVTGTILSFEMGLLWPEFMATFGAVFGLAFGIEGFSFFVEAIFIAIYVYGWDRLPARVHVAAGVPIVLAGISGSLMVISVNGWMNHPVGFSIRGGEVVDVKPLDALFNANLWHELVHMYLAGFIVAGFLVAGVYAYGWLRGRRDRHHRVGLVVALSVAALAAPAQLLVGDWAARTVAERQPVKLAAFEGLERTTKGAPFSLPGGIEVPDLLSVLAFHDPDATVTGLDSVPADDRPPTGIVKVSFRTMVFIGTALTVLGAWFLWVWWRHARLPSSPWFHRALVAAGPLALVALIAGWITTEVGRQPWIVYRVMRTESAVTGASGVPVGFAALGLVYAGLVAVAFVMLRRLGREPLEAGS